MTFGDWVQEYLDKYSISKQNLSDYSGIGIRSLYRMLTGEVKIKLEDWAWILECLSDMTNIDYNSLVLDCLKQTILKNDKL
jgi:predicted transcriptional regulator